MTRHFNFLGVKVSTINFKKAFQLLTSPGYTVPAYICFPDAYVVSEAGRNVQLMFILNNAFMCMPDGKPAQLLAHLYGFKEVSTVSGYHLCSALLETNKSHYFYGGTEELLQKLRANIAQKYPAANVLGYKAPPVINLEEIQGNTLIAMHIDEINRLKPDFVWVGISSPKQDYLMHHFYRSLPGSLMLGIGGAILYLADESLKSPEWMKRAGFRWLYRLVKEPRRLWFKYYSTFKFLLKNYRFFINAYLKNKEDPE